MNTQIDSLKTGLIEKPKFISFVGQSIIPPIKIFSLENFYPHDEDNHHIIFSESFNDLIIAPMKGTVLYLKEETLLNKFSLNLNNAIFDVEIQNDFKKDPVVPVKTFLPLLKGAFENEFNVLLKKEGLDCRMRNNLFFVDLTEIDESLGTVVVTVLRTEKGWFCNAEHFGVQLVFGVPMYFFSLCISHKL
ncbi:MAG: hypothetical protein WC011_03335 [Candidatus Paceibacterota bacterium]